MEMNKMKEIIAAKLSGTDTAEDWDNYVSAHTNPDNYGIEGLNVGVEPADICIDAPHRFSFKNLRLTFTAALGGSSEGVFNSADFTVSGTGTFRFEGADIVIEDFSIEPEVLELFPGPD